MIRSKIRFGTVQYREGDRIAGTKGSVLWVWGARLTASLLSSTIPCTIPPPPHCSSTHVPQQPHQPEWQIGGLRRVGRRGKQGQEDDDDAVCNPHTVLSSSFPPIYLMTRRETHMPRCLSLFLPILSDDVVWNPHATLSISFPPHIIWRRSVKPTCRIVYFFSSPYYLMTQCETHMPRCLFLFLPILSDDAVWNPHAASSISFPPILSDDTACNPHAASSISFPPHIIWQCGVQPTRHLVYSLVLFPPYYLTTWCETHTPRCLFLFPPYYLTTQCETHTPCHLFLFPSILSDDMAIYIPLEFIRSILRYNL